MNIKPIYFRFLDQFMAVLGTLEISHFYDSFFFGLSHQEIFPQKIFGSSNLDK